MRITLGIGESRTVTVAGGRFYYEAGLGAINVKTIGNDVADFDLKPGMGFQNEPGKENFFAVVITNKHDAQQDVDFIISYREVYDNRVTFGGAIEVSGVGGSPLRTLDAANGRDISKMGIAFIATRNEPALGASVYTNTALRNPVGSTSLVFVKRVLVSSSVAIEAHLIGDPAITTTEALPAVSLLSTGILGVKNNKIIKSGVYAGVAAFDKFASSSFLGGSRTLARVGLAAGGVFQFEFIDPLVVYPGSALIVSANSVNVPINSVFEYTEEGITS